MYSLLLAQQEENSLNVVKGIALVPEHVCFNAPQQGSFHLREHIAASRLFLCR